MFHQNVGTPVRSSAKYFVVVGLVLLLVGATLLDAEDTNPISSGFRYICYFQTHLVKNDVHQKTFSTSFQIRFFDVHHRI